MVVVLLVLYGWLGILMEDFGWRVDVWPWSLRVASIGVIFGLDPDSQRFWSNLFLHHNNMSALL
jgi:hypothetical protein